MKVDDFMSEKKAIFIISILKNIVEVYFNTFFIFYFFKVANYEVIPLAKYYITLYISLGIGFFLIRNAMKRNNKVTHFRIGISLQALYISLIMILKENIINYIFLVAFIKGIADGFYYFPKNILDTEKITNDDRQKTYGAINIINQIVAILIPLILGIALTFMSYTNLGKIFFVIFIIMFIISFYVHDKEYYDKKFEFKKFINLLKENKSIRNSLIEPLLSGFTFSSGVMGLIITLSKIYNFKTNLNLGLVDSICAILSLLACTIFTIKMKKQNFNKILLFSGIISFITLIIFAFFPTRSSLILYLLIRNSLITIISLIASVVVTNLTNSSEINEKFKPEYYCFRDNLFSISRSLGYILLLLVCIFIGKEYISYIMIIPAISIILEAIIIGKLCNS